LTSSELFKIADMCTG